MGKVFPYVMLLSGLCLTALSTYAWFGRRKPSVHAFAWMLAAIALWLICMAGWSLSPTPALALRWFQLQFAGVVATPVWLLIYALQFTGRGSALRSGRALLLWLIPLTTLAVAWSPAFHPLLFTRVAFAPAGGSMVLKDWTPGPWFFLHSSYSFGLTAVAITLLIQAALRSPGIFRRQVVALLTAIIPALLLTLLNALKILPPDQLITPMGFLLAGAAILWAVLRTQLTNLAPVARDLLIEQMEDGMLVIDEHGRIVDCNPAMQALLGRPAAGPIGMRLEQTSGPLAALSAAIDAHAAGQSEVVLSGPAGPRYFDLRLTTLDLERHSVGRLVVLRDITKLKQTQAELFALATTDALTRLWNRRQFFDMALPQIALAERKGLPFALLLYDIDSFKQINDIHGHAAGDSVLASVAARSAGVLRSSDLLCRYGGEEFVALLMNTARPEALIVAERLRMMIAAEPIAAGPAAIMVTISVGLVVYAPGAPVTLDALLRVADEAMYRAKRAGKNCVVIADAPPGSISVGGAG